MTSSQVFMEVNVMKNDEVIVDIVKSMKKSVDEFVEYVETIISVHTAMT